jgi:hypothetical protein
MFDADSDVQVAVEVDELTVDAKAVIHVALSTVVDASPGLRIREQNGLLKALATSASLRRCAYLLS